MLCIDRYVLSIFIRIIRGTAGYGNATIVSSRSVSFGLVLDYPSIVRVLNVMHNVAAKFSSKAHSKATHCMLYVKKKRFH